MNQHNLISIVATGPTVQTAEMSLEEETKSQKRRNLIERIRKLRKRLSYMHEFSNEDKRKLNQQYQQNLQEIEKRLLMGKISRNGLSKIEISLNAIEEKIPVTDSIFCRSYKTAVSAPIDLTNDDDTRGLHNSSSIRKDELVITDLTREDGTPQLDSRNTVLFSTGPCTDKIQKIIDIDEIYENLVSVHPTMSDAEEKHTFEERIDKTPALRILEMAKQNTDGKCSLPITNSSPPLLSTIPTNLNVTERVTKLIQILPVEDKMLLKGGVDKVQELVEKKTKSSAAPLQSTDFVQTSNLPRLSELLLEQMKVLEEVLPVPIASDIVPMIHPVSKPELSNNVIGKNVDSRSTTILKPVNIGNRAVRPHQRASIPKVPILKHPPNVRFDTSLAKKITPEPMSSNERLIPSRSDIHNSSLNSSKNVLPYKSDRSAPLPIPNLTEPRKHDLKTKFSQEIGVVHKVGESYKIAPSLKQLKNNMRLSSEKPLLSSNVKPIMNVTPSQLKNTYPKENKNLTDVKSVPIQNQISCVKSSSTQKQVSVDAKLFPRQSSHQLLTTKKSYHHKLAPVKKNPIQNLQPRRSLECGSKNQKLSTNFQSPLAGIYGGPHPPAKTGLGYGAQQFTNKFKIPRLNKTDKAEEDKSAMNQNILKGDHLSDTDETISELEVISAESVLIEKNRSSVLKIDEKSTASVLPQKICQPKQIVFKSSNSAIDQITVEEIKMNDRDQNYEKRSSQNLPEDTTTEELVEVETCLTNLDSSEGGHRKRADVSLGYSDARLSVLGEIQKDEKLSEKSIPDENDSLAKPFSINLGELNSIIENEKSYSTFTSKQDETIKGISIELVDCTKEKYENDRGNSICSEKYVKQNEFSESPTKVSNVSDLDVECVTKLNKNDFKLAEKFKLRKNLKARKLVRNLDASSEIESGSDSDNNDSNHSKFDEERKNFKCKKLVTTSEESNSDTQSGAQKSRRKKKKPSTSVELIITSDDSEVEIKPVRQSISTNQKILSSSDEENDVPRDRSSEKPKRSQEPTLPDISRLCFNHCTCANDIMMKLDDSIEENIETTFGPSVCDYKGLTSEDVGKDNSCKLFGEVTEPVLNIKTTQEVSEYQSNKLANPNQEAIKRENNTDLLDFLKSSSELENIRGILNKIDVTELNWSMHLFTLLPTEQLRIVQELIKSYYSDPKETSNRNTKSMSKVNIEAPNDDTSMNEGQNLVIKNNDQEIGSGKPVQSQIKPRKKGSRELARLHEDIKEMKKTKNNIFTAIGERKCRQHLKTVKTGDVSVPSSTPIATSSHENLELPNDDSVYSEKRFYEQSFPSTEFISDDNLASSQFVPKNKIQQVDKNRTRKGRRGRPLGRTKLSRLEVDDAVKLEPKIAPRFKPGPKCMKLKLYGEEAFYNNHNIVKPLTVNLSKVDGPGSSPEVDLGKHNRNVENTKEAENIQMTTLENEIVDCKTVAEDRIRDEVHTSSDVEKAIRKKKKKKKNKEKKAKENEHLKKMLKECENTATTLNLLSTEERRRSSILNLPINEPENISQVSDIDSRKESLEEHTNRKMAGLPNCNAFKVADVTCAKILCIAIVRQDTKLLYKCVDPTCKYSVTDSKIFAHHVSSKHEDAVWDGYCQICKKTVVMHSRANLIDALSHLMGEHLTWTNMEVVPTVVLSDDDEKKISTLSQENSQKKELSGPMNANNADVIHVGKDGESGNPSFYTSDDGARGKEVSSPTDFDLSENEMGTETSTPRLRVRRLSGDILSGISTSDTPNDSTIQSVSNSDDGSEGPALSLVIKEVKTIREKELLNLLPHQEECAVPSKTSSTVKHRKNEENFIPKPLSKSAQSELSIIKLYKCGGTSWNNPETCKFSSDKSTDFLMHLYRGHMCTYNKKEKQVAKKFLKCVYCGTQNADPEKLIQHIENVHGNCLFQCAFCEYRAARPVYLDWHRENEHKLCERMILVTEWKDNKDEVLKRSRSSQWSKPYQDIVSPFTCTNGCTYSTYSETQFLEHCSTNHSGLQTWDCSVCGQKCFDLAKLMMHYKVHSMAKFQCRYCLYGVSTVVALKIHLAKIHPHLYPLAIKRESLSSSDEIVNDPWATRIAEVDLDLPLSNFKSYSKVINVDSRSTEACNLDESSRVDRAPNSLVSALPMSIVEETEAAVSTITCSENPSVKITCQPNETRRTSSGAVLSLYSSDDDVSDRLISNGDESDDSNSTIAERLRHTRRASAEIQQPIFSRTRTTSKDYIRGLTGDALFKCGVAGCTISVDEYKAYVEHLRVCDNARNATGFECPHCEYKVQTTKAFLNHLTLHGPARYLCTLCDFKHQQSKYVVEHMKSSAHRVHGEPKIMAIHPLKDDKHKDIFIVKFDSNKVLRNRGARTPAETCFTPPRLQPSPAPASANPPKQIEQITTVNSLEDVEKHLHTQLYRQYINCGICNYKDRVRSNLLNHMKEHATGGLPISQNIVNPVPEKNEADLMFNKMSNHAGFNTKNDDKPSGKCKDETTNNTDEADRISSIVPEFVPKRRRYACSAPECRYFSLDAGGLRHHYDNLHSALTEFMCPHCQIKVASSKISVHLRYHGEKLYRCAICRTYVHFQRMGIEKHQREKHPNSNHNIEILREIPLTDPEMTGSELPPDYGVTAISKVSWKCNLCGDRSSSEFVMISHCEKEHSISYKYKCCLCYFGTVQKDDMDEHLKTSHETSSKIFLTIYEEVDQMTTTGSVPSQQKLKTSEISVTRNNQTPTNVFDYDEANFSSNSTPSSLSFTDLTELNNVERSSLKSLEIVHATNVKETTNEMIVEPYPDQSFKCPFCPTFKTANVKTMRYHLFREKQYDRYVCNMCGKLGVSRYDLEPHIVEEINTHPPKNQDYICKLTADPILEQKVNEALIYQYRKLKPESLDDPFSSLDSDEDSPRSNHSDSLYTELNETLPKQYSKRSIVPKHKTVFCCHVCFKFFTTQKGLTRHENIHKPKSTKLRSPRKRASGELLSTDDSTMLHDGNGKLNQSDGAKRTRYSSPVPGRSSVESITTYRCKSCDKILDRISDFREHQKMAHLPYPCLQCDKILLGEQSLTNHVRTSYRLQSNKESNSECIKSTSRIVIMKCSSPDCSYFLTNVSYQTYIHIKQHMTEVHPPNTASSVMVKIDTYEPRPLTDIEISFLQANELPSAQLLPRAPLKRRNVAVKSTARPATRTVEPANKIMFIDPPPTIITTTGRNNSFRTRITSSGDENDAGTPPTTEVIDLSDDTAEKIIEYYVD